MTFLDYSAVVVSITQISWYGFKVQTTTPVYNLVCMLLPEYTREQIKSSIHSFLTTEIRNMVGHLTMLDWTIQFGWVKAHTGIEGNEMADKLAKEAAQDAHDQNTVYARIARASVAIKLKKEEIVKWQRQWENTEKGAMCRSFFLWVEQRLKMKLPITPEFTAIVTGHGKTKSYLHRFKLTDNTTCPCNEGVRRPEHLIYDCKLLEVQRSS
jgi:hypothetical protein